MSDKGIEYGKLLNNRKHVSCIKENWDGVIQSYYVKDQNQHVPYGYLPVIYTNEKPDPETLEQNQHIYFQFNLDEGNNRILKTFYVSTNELSSLCIEDYETAVQKVIDKKVQEKGYDNVYTCLSYKGDPDPIFSAEADAVLKWRSQVWRTAQGILNQWMQGQIEQPTIQQVLDQLPQLEW